MKSNEILLASAVIGAVAGVLGALAAHSFLGSEARGEARLAPVFESTGHEEAGGAPGTEVLRALDDLRMGDVALAARLDGLEARLSAVATRTPLEASPDGSPGQLAPDTPARIASMLGDGGISSPEFVETVGRALDEIRAQEEAEREARRRDLQRQRIEDRVARLQESLGLAASQTRDLRTALLTQDEKREALFASMRDGDADPMTIRDSMRTLRDETNATLQGILTPDQYDSYQETERDDFRGGFGGGGGRRGGGGGAGGDTGNGGGRRGR